MTTLTKRQLHKVLMIRKNIDKLFVELESKDSEGHECQQLAYASELISDIIASQPAQAQRPNPPFIAKRTTR